MSPQTPGSSASVTRLQQSRWEAVLNTVQDAVISIDVGGRVTLFNRAAEEIFGYSAADVIGKNVNLLMPSPYAESHDGYIRQYRETGIGKAIGRIRDVHARRASGEVFPIELSVSEARFEDETVFMAIIRDVSERVRHTLELDSSAAALRESEARSRAILDSVVDAVVTIDEGGIVDLINPAALRMFGYRADEVIGKNIKMLMPEPYRGEHDGYLANYRRTGERKIIGKGREVVGLRKDGSVFPVYLGVSEVRFGDHRLFTGLLQDLSERRDAEARLREMEKAAAESQRLADIGAITAQIVHDLGNPLAGISMQAQLITRRARRNPKQPIETVLKAAEQIVNRVKHLDSLVHDFLEFAREQRLKVTAVDLTALLHELGEFWQPLAAADGIELTVEIPETPLTTMADQEKLRRVFDNLLKNAIEAVGDGGGGKILMRADDSDHERVRVEVIDNGPGVPQELDVFRLFETTKPLGTGLGLPIARQIITAHGGGIDVAPADPHGAHFQIELPRRGPIQ